MILHCRLPPAPPSLTAVDNDSRCQQTDSARACPGYQARGPGAAWVLAQHARSSEAAIRQAHWVASSSSGLALRALERRVARGICDDALHGADGSSDGDNEADEADGLRTRAHTPQSPWMGVLQDDKRSQCGRQRGRACIHHQVPDQRWTLFCTM